MRQDDPLMEAAKKGDLESIKKILIDVKSDKNKAIFVLYCAVCCGYCHVLDWLKEQGCDMQVKFKGGLSGLHVAAQNGQIAVLEWYLKEGADLAERDEGGCMPVHCAAHHSQVKVLDWLKAKGCDMQAVDNDNWDLLEHAVQSERDRVYGWITENDYNLLLAQHICEPVAPLGWFKDHGYDLLPSNKDENPFQVALREGRANIVAWYCRNAFYFGFQTIIEQFWNGRSTREEFTTMEEDFIETLLEAHLENNPRVLLHANEEELNTLVKMVEKTLSSVFLESLKARINLTKAYQKQNFDCFLEISCESCEDEFYGDFLSRFFKADIKAYMENRNELLGSIIDTLLGFLLKHYQLSGPQYFLGEFARHFHDDYRAGGLKTFPDEREINNLKISTLCLLTQDLSNSNNQSLYCANLSFLIRLKIIGEVRGFTLTDLIQNYPDEIISILDELKDLYEQLIERELNVLEPTLFASQMNLALREKLRKVEEENQVLRDELNEFRKRLRNEEPDNNPPDAKKMNDSSSRLSPGPEFFSSESRKREREEDPDVNQGSKGEARLNENPLG